MSPNRNPTVMKFRQGAEGSVTYPLHPLLRVNVIRGVIVIRLSESVDEDRVRGRLVLLRRRCLVVNVLLYRILWRLGFTPWERMQPWAEQVSAMFDREEQGRQPPYGAALDLGCGTGIWSVDLAEREWDVTGVEIVPKALRSARERAQKAGVEVRFLEGSVAALRDAGVGSSFRLVLDFGTVHGLAPTEVKAVAREVNAVTTDDATLLMYAFSPGRKGPTPRGLSREEVEAAYTGWSVVDEQPFDVSGMPAIFKKANPHWYRLRRD